MNAELVFDGSAAQVIALAKRAVLVDQHFWHQKEGYSFGSRRRVGQAGEHHMDDIVSHVVLAV